MTRIHDTPEHSQQTAQTTQTLRIHGTGTPTNYTLTVTEQLRDDIHVTYNATGNISGRNAEGTVYHDIHGYRFDGDILDIAIDGEATVTLDGVPLSLQTDGTF